MPSSSSPSSLSCLDQLLADEWIVGLAQDWLNPREQRHFASTCRRFHELLPAPLRIQIGSFRTGGNMDSCRLGDGSFFVSRVVVDKGGSGVANISRNEFFMAEADPKNENTTAAAVVPSGCHHRRHRPRSNVSSTTTTLDYSTPLEYHTPYYFWKFDYQEQCPVFLGRQFRQTQPKSGNTGGGGGGGGNGGNNGQNNNNNNLEYRFTLGLRPRFPNQFWEILPISNKSNSKNVMNKTRTTKNIRSGDDKEEVESSRITSTTKRRSCSNQQEDATIIPKGVVSAGQPLELVVSGWEDARPGQIDSTEVHKLTARVRPTHSGRPIWAWHTVKNRTASSSASSSADDDDDDSDDDTGTDRITDLSFAYTTSHLVRPKRPESELFLLFPSSTTSAHSATSGNQAPSSQEQQQQQLQPIYCHPRRRKRSASLGDGSSMSIAQTFPLETYAIPDISDRGAYLLYSPRRWRNPRTRLWPEEARSNESTDDQDGSSTPESPTTSNNNTALTTASNGRSAIVEFSFWSTHDILYFKACSLPFVLAIPIVEEVDREFFSSSTTSATITSNNDYGVEDDDGGVLLADPQARPMIHLFESFSARWGCIKYYMATAADVREGCTLQMDAFLRGLTDHDDHQVQYYPGAAASSSTNTTPSPSTHNHQNEGTSTTSAGAAVVPHLQQEQPCEGLVSIVMKQQQQEQQQQSPVQEAEPRQGENAATADGYNSTTIISSSGSSSNHAADTNATIHHNSNHSLVPDIVRDDSERWRFFFSW